LLTYDFFEALIEDFDKKNDGFPP